MQLVLYHFRRSLVIVRDHVQKNFPAVISNRERKSTGLKMTGLPSLFTHLSIMQMPRSVRVLTFFQYGFSSRTRKISYAIQGKTTLELCVTWYFINHTIDLFLGFFFQFRHLFLSFLYFSWNLQTQHTRL